MALTATQRAQVLEIFGLPAAGGSLVVTSLVHWPFSNTQSWEPTYNVGNMSALITAVDVRLTAMSAETEQLVIDRKNRYFEIIASPMKVTSAAGGAGGNLVDHKLERENLRREIANLVGVAVPEGGFLAEIQATYGKSLAKWANTMGGGIGDR